MRHIAFLAAIWLAGCATTQAAPTIPNKPSSRVEAQPLPPDPETEEVEGLDPADWVVPLEAASCIDSNGDVTEEATRPCPDRSGIAVSEGRAVRDKLYRIRYKELRLNYEADRKVWAAQRELYEQRLQDANKLLEEAQPSWFQQHALEIGVLSGSVLGAAMAVGIVYSMAPAMGDGK